MSTSGIPPSHWSGKMLFPWLHKASAPAPQPPPAREEDTVTLSPEARQQARSVPDAVRAAVADLKGDQANLASDFRTIGDYFREHGGRAALDAFMRDNFTQGQLQAFPPPQEGPGSQMPPPPLRVPEALASAVSDLKGGRVSLGEDLKAIGDYFRVNGGREAHRAFMKATFSETEREVFRQFHEAVGAALRVPGNAAGPA